MGKVVRPSQGATIITFSEFPVGTAIGDQYKDVGIIFGGSSPFITTDLDNPTSPVLSGTPTFQGAITGTFVVPGTTTPSTVGSFSLDAGFFDEIGTTELRWFDSTSNLIGSQTNTSLGIQTLTATAPGIASWSIQIISTEPAGYAIDNVHVESEDISLDCGEPVVRGEMVTCEVAGGPVESVSVVEWKFVGTLENGAVIDTIRQSGGAPEWSGIAVLSGTVWVRAVVAEVEQEVSADLTVVDRDVTLAPWQWNLSKWHYTPGGGDPTCPNVPTFGLFTTAYGGALGVNMSTDTCLTRSITPNTADPNRVFGQPGEGADPAEVQGGPNRGLWYVESANYTMDRASLYSPFVFSGAPEHNLSGSDLTLCQNAELPSPSTASFYEFNVVCKGDGANIQNFHDGIEDHEGLGITVLLIGSRPSGHESVRRQMAGEGFLGGPEHPGNPRNPYAAVEGLVRESEAFLKSVVGLEVEDIDDTISGAAGQHTLVNNNWCGDAWKYQPGPTVGSGTFVLDPIRHESGACL